MSGQKLLAAAAAARLDLDCLYQALLADRGGYLS